MYANSNPTYPFLNHNETSDSYNSYDYNDATPDQNATNVPFTDQTTLTLDRVSPHIIQAAGQNYGIAQLSVFNSKLRAAMAKQALDNTTMLALAEQRCLEMAPNGANEYRKIVQAYAYSSIRNILGGD